MITEHRTISSLTLFVSLSCTHAQSGPGVLALAIVSKEILFRVTKKIGERNNSSVLIANAYHHRSDVWASVVALAGLGGGYFGSV